MHIIFGDKCCFLDKRFKDDANKYNQDFSGIQENADSEKEDSGQVSIYKNQKLWFARRSDQFPYTVSKYMKTQWLADDICAVTYYSPDDDAVHQYVATYGDRGDGITTPYVYNMISGSWGVDNKNIVGWSLEVGIDGLNIHNGSKQYHYEAKDCVQFGTLALALCENGLPQWTIALNEDCVEEDGYLTEGTITLCKVSLEKTAPMRFYGSGRKKYFEESAEPLSDKEAGQKIKKEMEEVLLEDKRLANFESVRDKVKVVTESTDLFWISRLALEENEKLSVLEGYGFDVQIDRMRIIAGDQYDFVVKIESTDTFTETDKEDADGVQMEFIFRIMKGENAYLAVCLPYGVDGTVGLEAPGMEQSKVTKDDPQYHFFGKGIAK